MPQALAICAPGARQLSQQLATPRNSLSTRCKRRPFTSSAARSQAEVELATSGAQDQSSAARSGCTPATISLPPPPGCCSAKHRTASILRRAR